MAAVEVNTDRLHEFADFDAFYGWLEHHHDREDEVWIRIFKKGSCKPSISPAEAIDAVLCWGWIDAIRKSWDEQSFVQRYCRRRPKSVWSQVNRDNVERLLKSNKMTEHGLIHVEAAKADGRWDAAYATTMAPPEDLLAAIAGNAMAQAIYQSLSAQNRFALTFRTNSLKTETGRKKKIESFVAMLARGETIYPQQGKSK
jgi:uncharacterized protein YdeI (YjbR/CyaY-like superfamily)